MYFCFSFPRSMRKQHIVTTICVVLFSMSFGLSITDGGTAENGHSGASMFAKARASGVMLASGNSVLDFSACLLVQYLDCRLAAFRPDVWFCSVPRL
jgi:hypothetical protein